MDDLATATPLRDALVEEQETLSALLDEIVGASEVEREARWPSFVDALVAQLDAEDELVSVMPWEGGARILVQEHRFIRERLGELVESARGRRLGAAALKNLSGILRAHARNDDRILYRWAERTLPDERCVAVLEAARRRTSSLQSRRSG
jgi:hypothetical protein